MSTIIPGLKICVPTSINFSGTSASIRADGGVDFSAVTSLSLNGVFSLTYDNYMVKFSGSSGTALNVNVRLRASGVDATGTSYARQSLIADGTTISASRSTGAGDIPLVRLNGNTLNSGVDIYAFGPHLSQPTATRSVAADPLSSARILDFAATHSLSSSYDGISFVPDAANMTGTVYVYGFTQ